ncbi:MAG: UTP--glucose-1-phosphate uridylyltransferase, partial [Lachnospiraceae bacterium]|nr:UTP--glucose-1-phosphate uridylyltransferase [Lachnospiraceae bacterium]
MTYAQAEEKLKQYGQEHVLRYYDELEEAARAELLEQIAETDFSVLDSLKQKGKGVQKGKITPLGAMELAEIEKGREHFCEIGMQAIRDGKVGAVLLAGGMGTRLGSDEPKGVYNIGITKEIYIFERLIVNLLAVVRSTDTWIPLFVMTSDKNHDATVHFLTEHGFFGYKSEHVYFFKQEMAPAADYDGKIYMESKSRMSTSPNGNGGWYVSMKNTGVLNIVKKYGIEWLNVFAVDNVLQRIADPVFIGAVIEKQCAVGAKVVRKNAPDEKVGVMCLEDGRPSIVEYYELTEELMNAKNEKGEPAYNFGVILNYLFKESALHEMLEKKLPLHVVEKKIPYMDEAGNMVKPEEPTGCTFANLVLVFV